MLTQVDAPRNLGKYVCRLQRSQTPDSRSRSLSTFSVVIRLDPTDLQHTRVILQKEVRDPFARRNCSPSFPSKIHRNACHYICSRTMYYVPLYPARFDQVGWSLQAPKMSNSHFRCNSNRERGGQSTLWVWHHSLNLK